MSIISRERYFPSATGLGDIRYRLWIPDDPRAALQITHGMSEYIDRYDAFAGFLAENGILVYGCDLTGHGKTVKKDGVLGYFGPKNGWDANLQDMRTMHDLVKAEFPALPYILMGHSMGSFLARTYAGRDGADFDAFIFSGTAGSNPVLGIAKFLTRRSIKKTGGGEVNEKLYNLCFGAFNKSFAPARTNFDWLTRDEAVVDAYVVDPLCGFPFTTSGMLDIFDGLAEISSKKWAERVPNKPILVFSGARDPVGGNGKGVKQVFGWLKSTGHNAELKLYEDGRHEMLNELNREEVYGDVLLFLETVIVMGETA